MNKLEALDDFLLNHPEFSQEDREKIMEFVGKNEELRTFNLIYAMYDGKYQSLVGEYCKILKEKENYKKAYDLFMEVLGEFR